jgi:two-component system phosphate regulon sensor histidine kinase PhoR
MQRRIYKSLLLMGAVSVLLTFILAGVLHYQSLQEQETKQLSRLATALASGISATDESQGVNYLSQVYSQYNHDIQILWMDNTGHVLYSSQGQTSGEDLLSAPNVQEAEEKGIGQSVHKDNKDTPKNYVSTMVSDGTILTLSRERLLALQWYKDILPETLVFIIVFFVGCIAAAEAETQRILQPLHKLGDLVFRIMEGEKIEKIPSDYDEVKPFLKKMEEQHRDIENYLEDIENERNTIRAVIDTISDGIILLNSHKIILDYNKQTAEIFHPNEDKRFRRIASLYYDEDWLRAIGRSFRSSEKKEYTMTLFDHPFRVIMTRLLLTDGEKGLLIVLRDMTSVHAAEKMRREFTSNVSHELRTPLTSISGFAEMIVNGMYKDPEDVKNFGTKIYDESQRMLALIDTIMHLSKIEETETTIMWNVVAVDSLVKYAADLIQNQADKRHIAIHVDTEPVYIYGNAALISELIMNLLDNALKYNHENGSVDISLKPVDEKQIVLSVSDTGIGIPKDKQQRVFERFYRADESRDSKTGGSGLGLAICKHIVLRHKGHMEIHSEEGEGTTISVYLPRLSDQEAEKEKTEALLAQKEAENAESGALAQQEKEEDQAEAQKEEELTAKEELENKKHDKSKKNKKNKKSKKKKDKEKSKDKSKK